MRGKLKQLWHRHLDRKPWVFRDEAGFACLFTPEDEVAALCDRRTLIENPAIATFLRETLKPGQTFVDLSPENGGISLLAAKIMQANGAVFAFTPDVKLYRQLVNNAALNSFTGCVRVIGRSVLETPETAVAITLDQFAASWNWTTVDCMRLRHASLFAALEKSAGQILAAGRVHNLLLDEVDSAQLEALSAKLKWLGYTVRTLGADEKPAGKCALIASRGEAAHG